VCGRRGGGTGLELGGGIFYAGIFWFEGLFLGEMVIWFLLWLSFCFLFGPVMILRVAVGVMTGGQSVMLGELPYLLLFDGMSFLLEFQLLLFRDLYWGPRWVTVGGWLCL
jgi:hypothetical protein